MEPDNYQPSKLEIVNLIDPDWRDHFIDADQAYDFYAINPDVIDSAIEELKR